MDLELKEVLITAWECVNLLVNAMDLEHVSEALEKLCCVNLLVNAMDLEPLHKYYSKKPIYIGFI